MRRSLPSFALAVVACAVVAVPAAAHQGNPDFRSVIEGITPQVAGVTVQVLNLDDRLELVNRSGRTVIAYGYNEEPYVRILGDGTVQVNRRSPAASLNRDRYGAVSTPASADAAAAPQWQTVDRTGRYEWHDHRIHYMAKGTPPQVKNEKRRTKVFDWRVPIAVGTQRGAIIGVLLWQPQEDSGPPRGAIAGLIVLLAAGGAAVVLTRRRRTAEDADADAGGAAAARGEAW